MPNVELYEVSPEPWEGYPFSEADRLAALEDARRRAELDPEDPVFCQTCGDGCFCICP